jgi:hypothetical protein
MFFAHAGLRVFLLAAAVVVSPLAGSVAHAQSRDAAGPTVSAASIGARRQVSAEALDARDALASMQVQRGHGQDVALMVVGAGAFVAGALVGGDVGPIFMVGGAILGLYGLYLYLK